MHLREEVDTSESFNFAGLGFKNKHIIQTCEDVDRLLPTLRKEAPMTIVLYPCCL